MLCTLKCLHIRFYIDFDPRNRGVCVQAPMTLKHLRLLSAAYVDAIRISYAGLPVGLEESRTRPLSRTELVRSCKSFRHTYHRK
jgi:hypothetical protein